MTKIAHCRLCELETLSTSLRNGVCRARVSCHARCASNRPDWMNTFFALPADVRHDIASRFDAQQAAAVQAMLADDYSVKFPNMEKMVAEAVASLAVSA